MARFSGSRIVVTGAASGLGREVAVRLAAGGARLALADRNAEALAAVAAETGAVLTRPLDVSHVEAVAAFAADAGAALGGIDGLVNAAGVLGPAVYVADCPPDEWDHVFAVNVKGSYLMVRHLIPFMREAGGGSIVNFASTAGLAGSRTAAAYTASQGASSR